MDPRMTPPYRSIPSRNVLLQPSLPDLTYPRQARQRRSAKLSAPLKTSRIALDSPGIRHAGAYFVDAFGGSVNRRRDPSNGCRAPGLRRDEPASCFAAPQSAALLLDSYFTRHGQPRCPTRLFRQRVADHNGRFPAPVAKLHRRHYNPEPQCFRDAGQGRIRPDIDVPSRSTALVTSDRCGNLQNIPG
jgi:hypothetical protein